MKKKLTETEQLKEETLKESRHRSPEDYRRIPPESAKPSWTKPPGDAAAKAAEIVKKGNEASALEHQKDAGRFAPRSRSARRHHDQPHPRARPHPDERSRFTTSAAQDLSKKLNRQN